MSKLFEEAYDLIVEIVINNYRWPSDRVIPKRVASIYEFDVLSILTTQVATIFKKLDIIGVNLITGLYT
ncbi:hypothetical protein MA16_Dca008159 [Dendrobium catenatum]|uniref:Uncharacterized protein n=1 Tax=Dendrobium catenatum TaxID=906689 RepID=A0A2I0XA00_9ASPA|nr:hypothetical protein MA16_Dca008159 [Dendrobium catenatum]